MICKIQHRRNQQCPDSPFVPFLTTRGSPYISVYIQTVGDNPVHTDALLDTGAVRTIASSSWFSQFKKTALAPASHIMLQSASKHPIHVLGTLTSLIQISNANIYHPIIIVDVPSSFFLMGNDIISRFFTINGDSLYISKHGKRSDPIKIKYNTLTLRGFSMQRFTLEPNKCTNVEALLKVHDDSGQPLYPLADPLFLHQIIIASGEFELFHVKETSTFIRFTPSQNRMTARITLHNNTAYPITISKQSLISKFLMTNDKTTNPATFLPTPMFFYSSKEHALPEEPTYRPPPSNLIAHITYAEDDDVILNGSQEGLLPEPWGISQRQVYPEHLRNFPSDHMPPKILKSFMSLVNKFSDIVAKDSFDIGYCKLITLKIATESDKPVFDKPRVIKHHHQDKVRQILNDLQEANIISPCDSPYGANVVVVPKPDESIRLCIDYRKLNAATILQSQHPIPPLEASLHKLRDAVYKSKIDLTQAYYSIPISSESRLKTAFYALNKQYCYNRTPFGLTAAPSTWSYLMCKLFDDCLDFVIWYFDDVTIFSQSAEEHLKHLQIVFSRLQWGGQKIKMLKCQFFLRPEDPMSWLGHTIKDNAVYADSNKLVAISHLPVPKTVKQLQQFLGQTSALRKFINNFSDIAVPLHTAVKEGNKSGTLTWNAELQDSFDLIKQNMEKPPCLALPDPSQHFFVTTDASAFAIGAVLSQIHVESEHPVLYASRKFSDNEAANFTSPEKELYGIIFGLTSFQFHLHPKNFTVRTDAKGLIFLKMFADSNPRMNKLKLIILDNSFQIEHVSAKNKPNIMQVSDLLSRSYMDSSKPKRSTYKDLRHPSLEDIQVPEELVPHFPMSVHELWNKLDKFYPSVEESLPKQTLAIWDSVLAVFEQSCSHTKPFIRQPKVEDPVAMILLTSCIEPLFSFEVFKDAQEADPYCSLIFDCLTRKNPDVLKKFIIKNKLLFRLPTGEGTLAPRLVVPKALIDPIIDYYHSSPFAIHTKSESILRNLKPHFVWKNMETSIKHFIEKCAVCKFVDPSNSRVSLAKLQQPQFPNDIIHVDLVGPFHKSKLGNKYILTVVDAFSGFCQFITIPSKDSFVVAQALANGYFNIFGPPRITHSDQGGEFCNKVFSTLSTIFGFKTSHTPPFSPWSNGQAERYNRMLLRGLKTLVSNSSADYWDVYPSLVASALNNTKRKRNNIAPAELMLGSTYHSRAFLPLVQNTNAEIKTTKAQSHYLTHVCKAQRLARQITLNALEQQKKKSFHNFQRNQMILVRNFRKSTGAGSKKLEKDWLGPYLIIKVYPNTVVGQQIHVEKGKEPIIKHFHPKHIKLFEINSPMIERQRAEELTARKFLSDLGLPLRPLSDPTDNPPPTNNWAPMFHNFFPKNEGTLEADQMLWDNMDMRPHVQESDFDFNHESPRSPTDSTGDNQNGETNGPETMENQPQQDSPLKIVNIDVDIQKKSKDPDYIPPPSVRVRQPQQPQDKSSAQRPRRHREGMVPPNYRDPSSSDEEEFQRLIPAEQIPDKINKPSSPSEIPKETNTTNTNPGLPLRESNSLAEKDSDDSEPDSVQEEVKISPPPGEKQTRPSSPKTATPDPFQRRAKVSRTPVSNRAINSPADIATNNIISNKWNEQLKKFCESPKSKIVQDIDKDNSSPQVNNPQSPSHEELSQSESQQNLLQGNNEQINNPGQGTSAAIGGASAYPNMDEEQASRRNTKMHRTP